LLTVDGSLRGRNRRALTLQIKLSFEPLRDLFNHLAPFIVIRPFLVNDHFPAVSVGLDRHNHIARLIAGILHLNLDGGFKFKGCLAGFLHSAPSGVGPLRISHLRTSFFGGRRRRPDAGTTPAHPLISNPSIGGSIGSICTKARNSSAEQFCAVRMRFDHETSRYELLNAADAPDLLEAM
jgi:hypothetical protein